MRTKRFFIACMIISVCSHVNSQTLTNCLPKVGDIFRIGTSTTTLQPGPGGTNKVWDFIHADVYVHGTTTVQNVPASTQGQIPMAELERISTTPYAWYRTSLGDWEIVATGSFIYDDPRTILPLPFAFGEVKQDTWKYILNAGTIYTVTGKTTFTADASGYLITPGGNFDNVLRIHSIQTASAISSNQSVSSFTTDVYEYFRNGVHDVILSIQNTTNSTGSKSYHAALYMPSNNAIGLSELNSSCRPEVLRHKRTQKLELCSDRPYTAVFTDLNGREVHRCSKSGDEIAADLSHLPPALYVLTITDDGGETHRVKVLVEE